MTGATETKTAEPIEFPRKLEPELNDYLPEDHFDKMDDRRAHKAIDRYYTRIAADQREGWLVSILVKVQQATNLDDIKVAVADLVSWVNEHSERTTIEI